jgi:molybdopterin-synthase adenylyltransferase
MLDSEEKRKYLRQIIVPEIGMVGQEKLKNARVALVGCGGIGCPVLLYLASAGVGNIGIIDFDTVHITNIHRQILYGTTDVGRKKTEVAEQKIHALHPDINITIHDTMLDDNNANAIISEYDVVVDGSDNFLTRYIVNDACVELGKPLVYASILGFEGQLALFNYKGSKHLRDLFPEPPAPEEVPDCSENGVLATVPGTMGLLAANACIQVILGSSNAGNKLFILNCSELDLKVLNF